MSNKLVVREFIASWSGLDVGDIMRFLADDIVYHNMPAQPVSGKRNVEKFISNFIRDWTATNWELVSMIEEGDLVVAERLDHIDMGDKHVELPCLGIFEVYDGKIHVWRDYFDLATYMKAFS